MIYCNGKLFGAPLYESQTFMDKSPSSGDVTPESLLSGGCNVLTSGTLVKKDLVVKCGLFDENAVRIEDFDLWFRLCKNGVRIGYQEDVLMKYRIRTGSLTGDNVEKTERTIAALQMVKTKHTFTESENLAWEVHLKMSEIELKLEKGKNSLVKGDFIEARKNFSEANAQDPKFKLMALNVLLALSPKLTLILFKVFRPAEFLYIAASNNHPPII
jgi:GT2 family glycosyltransferase